MFSFKKEVIDIVKNEFLHKQVLVIGDLMLDRHIWGKVNRISPEAPVPVVEVINQTETAGGAGNVASNLSSLGIDVSVCGCVGNDPNSEVLKGIFKAQGMNTEGILNCRKATITKTRIIGGHQQMLRLDRDDSTILSIEAQNSLIEAIKFQLEKKPSSVILSDYAKGTLNHNICSYVINECRNMKIPILADPKGLDFTKYTNASAITPNRSELAVIARVSEDDLDSLIDAGRQMLAELNLDFILLTLGEHGMALIKNDGVEQYPTVAKDVFDVTGAGDTVIATLGAGLACGLELEDAVKLANIAAGVIVGKTGTVAITSKELLHEISGA